MLNPSLPINEQERLKALKRYDLLDTLPEEDFDNITYLASFICQTPVSLISIIDGNRQFFKSRTGIEISETSRDISFCAHAINNPYDIFEVEDARLDERFHDNPVVAGEQSVVFYAGVPLVTKDGFALGTLCVVDNKPHHLSEEQREVLRRLSKQVMYMLEIREKRNLEERFKLIDFSFRNSTTPMCFINKDGSVFDFNDATCNLLGYTREEYQNLTIPDINPLFDSEKWAERWKDIKANGGKLYNTRLKKKDGSLLDIEVRANIIQYQDIEINCATYIDVTEKKKADERLKLFDFIFRNANVPITIIKKDGTFFEFNEAAYQFFGCSKEEYKELTVLTTNASIDEKGWENHWNVLKKQGSLVFNTQILRNDRKVIDVEIMASLLKYGDDELNFTILKDVTEKKKLEERLRLVDFSFRYAATPILLLLPNATFYDFNDAILDLLGYTREEFGLLSIPDIDPSFDLELCHERWEQFREIKRVTFLNKLKKKDGGYVDVEIRNNLITYAELEINFCFITDITEKKRLEDKLKVVDYAFRNATIPMHFINNDGSVYDFNDAACELFGYNKDEYKDLSIFDISTRHTLQTWADRWESLKTRSDLPHTTKLKKKDNTLVDVEIRTDILEYENSSLSFTSFIDITEKKKAEEAIRLSNERYEYATIATSDVVWETDVINDMLYLGPNFTSVFGHKTTGTEYGPNNIWRINLHPDDLDRALASEASAIEGKGDKWEVEYRFKKANGEYANVIDRGFGIKDESGKVVRLIGAMQDITKRKQEEERIKLFETVIKNTSEAVIIRDANKLETGGLPILYINEAFTKMTGFELEEIKGKTLKFLTGPLTQTEERKKIRFAIENHTDGQMEVINYKNNGETFWADISIFPVSDSTGKITHWVSIQRDVTERKKTEAEKEIMLQELIRNNKDLTQFTYITTHNLRAPLTNLISICNLIKTDKIEDERTLKLIEGFKISTHYLNDTLHDLIKVLLIKENPQWDTEQVVFKDVLEKVKTSIFMKLTNMVATIKDNFGEAPSVYFSHAYMESIFLNLITNSLRYAHPQRYPLINLKTTMEPDGSTKLVYSDNGVGMDIARVRNKIFGLYQRFHNNPDGKGMGLYLIHSQITALGGKIEVDSEDGVGTTFTMTFK